MRSARSHAAMSRARSPDARHARRSRGIFTSQASSRRSPPNCRSLPGPERSSCLQGELGAGKSTFARAFIRALAAGTSDFEVPSPTFTLVQTYDETRMPVAHADLYRLDIGDAETRRTWVSTICCRPHPARRMAGTPRLAALARQSPTSTLTGTATARMPAPQRRRAPGHRPCAATQAIIAIPRRHAMARAPSANFSRAMPRSAAMKLCIGRARRSF